MSNSNWSNSLKRSNGKRTQSLPLELLAPLGCGIQTGVGTVMNSLAVRAGSSVAVFGVGSVGLAAVMAAHIVKARTIIAVDAAQPCDRNIAPSSFNSLQPEGSCNHAIKLYI